MNPNIAADPPPLPLSRFPSSLPDPPPGLLATKCSANNTKPVKEELLQESIDDQSQCSVDNKIATGSECKEVLHMYKNLLQQHAQKENAGFPVYTSESEGPPHARRFKSKVTLNGKSYETSEFFTTLKEAEQTAAKIACQALSVGVIQEEKGLYKNLLQELVQKKGLKCPSYETVSSGLSHKPVFVSTVEVGSESFRSVECKTRKLAEMNAAEVAYCALTKGNPPTNSSKVPPTNTPSFADNLPQNIQPTATTQKHQTSIDEGYSWRFCGKASLPSERFQCIGATNLEEYRKHIEKDPALERRFQPVRLPEPTVDEAIEILKGLRERYEIHHKLRYTDEALAAAAQLVLVKGFHS